MKNVRILINKQAAPVQWLLNVWEAHVKASNVNWSMKVFDSTTPDMKQFENEYVVVEVECEEGFKYLNDVHQYEKLVMVS